MTKLHLLSLSTNYRQANGTHIVHHSPRIVQHLSEFNICINNNSALETFVFHIFQSIYGKRNLESYDNSSSTINQGSILFEK